MAAIGSRSGCFRVIQIERAAVGLYVFPRVSAAGGPCVRENFFSGAHAHAGEVMLARVSDTPALVVTVGGTRRLRV